MKVICGSRCVAILLASLVFTACAPLVLPSPPSQAPSTAPKATTPVPHIPTLTPVPAFDLPLSETQTDGSPTVPLETLTMPATSTHTSTSKPSPTLPQGVVDGPSWITEADNGKAFQYRLTIRFGLDLDPSRFAFEDLDYSECPFIGQISNWSLNGPESLPVGFEVGEEGSCEIRVGQFHVHVIGVDWP